MKQDIYAMKKFPVKLFVAIGIILLLIVLIPSFIVIVNDGEVGVRKTLGKISDRELYGGIHFAFPPITSIQKWDVRTQQIEEQATVPSNEGLIVSLDVSVIYHLNDGQVAELYKATSRNYWDTLLIPYLRNAIRDISSKYKVADLYSEKGRRQVSIDMHDYLIEKLEPRGIIIEDVLLRDIKIPEELTRAIEAKLTADQLIQQKEFELEQAKLNAEIRVTEAKGIAEAQQIIDKTLTSEYLQYLAIQNINPDADVIYIPMDGLLPITEATRIKAK
ncbi:MAG: prohibitin family protein [Nanoarchaeota archaeon]|nr:prohibitin family protein [Nanoarchaeota archaeon]